MRRKIEKSDEPQEWRRFRSKVRPLWSAQQRTSVTGGVAVQSQRVTVTFVVSCCQLLKPGRTMQELLEARKRLDEQGLNQPQHRIQFLQHTWVKPL
jgi:exonuclease VII large subunit